MVGITVACTAVVLFAFGASLGHFWPVLLALLVAVATALGMRGRSIPEAPTPSVGVFALATATLLFSVVAIAFASWVLYWILVLGLTLLEELTPLDLDADSIAGWIAPAWLAGLLLGYSPTAARELASSLYPAAGLHSRLFDVTRYQRSALLKRAAGAVVGVGTLIVLAYSADLPGEDPGTTLLVSLMLVVSLFATPESSPRVGTATGSDVENVTRSLEQRGWTVMPSPQTGEEGIDPLLAEVDLFAYKGHRSLLLEVRGERGESTPTQWAACTSLLTAARALPRTVLPPDVGSVDPVMVLVDSEVEPAIDRFARMHDVSLIVLDTRERSTYVNGPEPVRDELESVAELAVSGRARASEKTRDSPGSQAP